MTQTRANEPASTWLSSLTIHGALISAASAALPIVGALVGLDVNGESLRQLGEQTVAAVQAIGGLAGMGLTIFGRLRANARLAQRGLPMRL